MRRAQPAGARLLSGLRLLHPEPYGVRGALRHRQLDAGRGVVLRRHVGWTGVRRLSQRRAILPKPLFQNAAEVSTPRRRRRSRTGAWSTRRHGGGRGESDFGYHRPFYQETPLDRATVGVVGGRVIYGATDGLDGLQLWSSPPGSASTPSPLLDSCGPDCSPLGGRGLLVANGRAFFVAADPNHGYEMWSTDGTKAGTRLLVDSCPGSCSGWESWDSTQRVMVAGNRVVFWTAHDLWITDGTSAGTRSLFHSDELLLGSGSRLVVALGDRLLFPGFDPAYAPRNLRRRSDRRRGDAVALLPTARGQPARDVHHLATRRCFGLSSSLVSGGRSGQHAHRSAQRRAGGVLNSATSGTSVQIHRRRGYASLSSSTRAIPALWRTPHGGNLQLSYLDDGFGGTNLQLRGVGESLLHARFYPASRAVV